MRRRWNKRMIVAEIRLLHQRGEKLNARHVFLMQRNLWAAVRRHCSSWRNAVQAAGIRYETVMAMRYSFWSRRKVIREIRRRKRHKLPLNPRTVEKTNRALYLAAKRCFGRDGWRKALRASGFNPQRIYQWGFYAGKAQVRRAIRRLKREGVPLYGEYLMRNGWYGLFSAGVRQYGSWQRAVEAAGFDYVLVRAVYRWKERDVIVEIRRYARRGTRLSHDAMSASKPSLVAAAIRQFGSWQWAVEAAGFNYRQHCKIWSTKAWIRTLTGRKVKVLEQRAHRLAAKRRKHGEKT